MALEIALMVERIPLMEGKWKCVWWTYMVDAECIFLSVKVS